MVASNKTSEGILSNHTSDDEIMQFYLDNKEASTELWWRYRELKKLEKSWIFEFVKNNVRQMFKLGILKRVKRRMNPSA